MKIILKELRETLICLTLIDRLDLSSKKDRVKRAMAECNELIAIFFKNVDTAESNRG